MKIDGREASAAGLQKTQSNRSTEASASSEIKVAAAAELEASGSFKLSQGARELATIRELAFREPEVRADVVRSAAADLAAGALVVDSNTLAEAMLGSLF